jgi:hypothetical protein
MNHTSYTKEELLAMSDLAIPVPPSTTHHQISR